MCDTECRACSPACAGGRTIGALAGAGLAVLAVASAAPAASEILLVIEDIGAVVLALIVAGAVALLWRAGVVAWWSRGTLRASVWTCTQVHVLSSAGVRGCARVRARRRLAATQVKALPVGRQGSGLDLARAVLPAVLPATVVPRSDALTTGPATGAGNKSIRVTTGPYRLGGPDRIVVIVDEAFTLPGDDAEAMIAAMMMAGRRP